uniref:Uncharacterized protein n=1 Tax=Rhizophora mucronata TaxID=61149 RepID=A0A2P2PKX8_RHIMU
MSRKEIPEERNHSCNWCTDAAVSKLVKLTKI